MRNTDTWSYRMVTTARIGMAFKSSKTFIFIGSRRFLEADSLPGFDGDYHKALEHNIWLGTEGSIDFALRTYNLDAIVVPSRGECLKYD
jgi:hypothetical protein